MLVGKLRDAVECAKRVEAISQKTKDFSYPESICHVAEIYRMGGQYSVAQKYYQQSIEKCLALTRGLEQHEQLQRLAEGNAAITRCRYAMALYKSGDITNASSQIEKALSTMTKQCLETSSASTFAQAALISAKLNQPDKADEYIEQAKSRYAKHGNEIKLELLDKFELLGEYAMVRNRFEEAEENYKQGIALSKEIGMENGVLIMLTLEGYAELLRKMNRDEEAIVYQQRFEAILKHATEELSPTTLDLIN
jgi:tetratricopeptide (TPR) repeat protein